MWTLKQRRPCADADLLSAKGAQDFAIDEEASDANYAERDRDRSGTQ
jgi:hypothetical protein